MGFLNNEGLKNVFSKIKSWTEKMLNDVNDRIVEIENIRDGYIPIRDCYMTRIDKYDGVLIRQNSINLIYQNYHSHFLFDNNHPLIPSQRTEYTIRGKGSYLKNMIWPSEYSVRRHIDIDSLNDYSIYDINIKEGEIVSAKDITGIERVIIYFMSDPDKEDYEISARGHDNLFCKFDGQYINFNESFNDKLTPGEYSIEIYGDFSNLIYLEIPCYITCIDCRFLSAANLHKVLYNLTFDDIMYPINIAEGYVDGATYRFNYINEFIFGDFINNLYYSYVTFDIPGECILPTREQNLHITTNDLRYTFEYSHCNNNTINNFLNEYSNIYPIGYSSFTDCETLINVGTLHQSHSLSKKTDYSFSGTTNLRFANLCFDGDLRFGYDAFYNSGIKELIISGNGGASLSIKDCIERCPADKIVINSAINSIIDTDDVSLSEKTIYLRNVEHSSDVIDYLSSKYNVVYFDDIDELNDVLEYCPEE